MSQTIWTLTHWVTPPDVDSPTSSVHAMTLARISSCKAVFCVCCLQLLISWPHSLHTKPPRCGVAVYSQQYLGTQSSTTMWRLHS
jgi:hypothetical protein